MILLFFCTFTTCRMGKECANAYCDCPIDHFGKKNQTVQDKWAYATKCTEAIVDAAFPLLLCIFCTHSEDKMENNFAKFVVH